ncbi:MAG TPA: hypothetical protein VFU15_06035 [Bacteroidia bacterium]|nr:hypothetical protein [Bacteroidia bacterium]
MKMKARYIFLLLLFASCKWNGQHPGRAFTDVSGKTLSPADYSRWFESDESTQQHLQQAGGKSYEVTFLPADLLALHEAGPGADENAIREAKTHYEDLVYFRLRIKDPDAGGEILKENISSPQDYQQRVTYCAFGMQRDISLLDEQNDTIPCALFNFERAYDVTPFVNFVCAFDRKEVGQCRFFTFVFNDRLFHNGFLKFSFTQEDLRNTPKLKP